MEAIAKNWRKAAFWRKKGRVGRKEPGGGYREIAEKAVQGIIVLQDGKLRYANSRARGFLKKPIEELSPEALVNLVHPDDRAMIMDLYARRLRGEETPQVYSFRALAGDGGVLWLEFSVSLIEWEGRPATLVLAENITERKKIEAVMADSERTIRTLLDASPAAEFLIEPDGKILVYNQTFERIFGEDGKLLTGRKIQDLLTPEENRVNQGKALEVMNTGKPVFFEDYHRGLWLGKRFSPILSEEGRVAKIACYGEDISERKRATEALKENEFRYRLLAENVSDFIWTADRNLRLTYVSPGVTRLLGYTPEEMMAQKKEDRLSPDSVAHIWKVHTQELAKEKKEPKEQPQPQVLGVEYRRKDGSAFWAETRVKPVFDSEGNIAFLVGITQDISDRKKAGEDLRESELRYRLLAENATDVIWTTDMNLRLTYVSPGVTRMRGFTPEEVMAQPTEKAYSPDSWALIRKVYAEELVVERRDNKDISRTLTLELEHRCKDGSLVWGETKISAIRDGEGKIIEILGVTRDITERKKAEKAARRWAEENAVMVEISRIISSSLEIEEVYERFAQEVGKVIEFENITIGIIDPGERSLAVNHVSGIPIPGREVGTILPLDGTAAEEIYKTRSSLFIHKENLEEAFRKFPKLNAAIEAGMQSMIVVPLIREDRVIGVLIILSTRPDAYTRADVKMAERVAIQIAGAVANAQLFGECRRMEQAVRDSEVKFRELFQNANDLIFLHPMIDDQTPGQFMEVNELACRKLGYTREELLRLTPRDIIFDFEGMVSSVGQEIFGPAKKPGENPHLIFETTFVAKDGKPFPVEVGFEVFTLKEQRLALAIVRDITDRKKAEQEMIDQAAHLEEMVRERTAKIQELEQERTEVEKMAATGVLAARIAHEINNPLAGIKGSFMLIQDAIPPDHPYHHYVGRIHGEINRIARVVRQMFELYRSPAEDQEEWGMEQMIQDIVALLKDEARERKVSFQLPVLPLKVRMPAGPIRQVLFNVIKNAVEASPVEGRVQVSLKGGEKEISIKVTDEGPGISEKSRLHIFKPFFSTKKGKQKGLGLGLSISKEIVESLGGSIRLHNLKEGGLLCQIDLPKGK